MKKNKKTAMTFFIIALLFSFFNIVIFAQQSWYCHAEIYCYGDWGIWKYCESDFGDCYCPSNHSCTAECEFTQIWLFGCENGCWCQEVFWM